MIYSIRDEHIYLLRTLDELQKVMARYEVKHLPGATGSKDVVHVKWGTCPTGDLNWAK